MKLFIEHINSIVKTLIENEKIDRCRELLDKCLEILKNEDKSFPELLIKIFNNKAYLARIVGNPVKV